MWCETSLDVDQLCNEHDLKGIETLWIHSINIVEKRTNLALEIFDLFGEDVL